MCQLYRLYPLHLDKCTKHSLSICHQGSRSDSLNKHQLNISFQIHLDKNICYRSSTFRLFLKIKIEMRRIIRKCIVFGQGSNKWTQSKFHTFLWCRGSRYLCHKYLTHSLSHLGKSDHHMSHIYHPWPETGSLIHKHPVYMSYPHHLGRKTLHSLSTFH